MEKLTTQDQQMQLCQMPKLSRKAKDSGCKGTIATVAIQALESGMTASQALTAVLEQFPTAKTSIKCIYWYASKKGIDLRNRPKVEGPKVETFEEILAKVGQSGILKTAETVTKLELKAPKLVKKPKAA